MQKFIKNYNKYQDKIKKYLIGDNDYLYGTIIGNKKGWRKNRSTMEYYSFLLYFSHETGRIERYLYNTGSKEGNKDIYVYNKYSDNKQVNKKKEEYIYLEELENLFNRDYINLLVENLFKEIPLKYLNFDILNNGKLDKDFYTSFILELIRDYLIFNTSFDYCNMKTLRHITKPIRTASINDKDFILKDVHLGCGYIDEFKYNQYFRNFDITRKEELKEFFTYYMSTKFIDYKQNQLDKSPHINHNFKLKLNVPKNFNKSYYADLLSKNQFNLELVTLNKNELPVCLIGLKNIINSRTILDYNDLNLKVNIFNEKSTLLLNSINKGFSDYDVENKGIIIDN